MNTNGSAVHSELRVRNLPGDFGKHCSASDHCMAEPLPDGPFPLCAKHLREAYSWASDLIGSNWDGAVREYVAGLHETFKPPRPLRQPGQGTVYFIRLGDRVKVGFSTNPAVRLKALPHEEVIGVVPGTRADEQAWHRLLADYHVVGEWFRAEPAVVEQLERVARRSA